MARRFILSLAMGLSLPMLSSVAAGQAVAADNRDVIRSLPDQVDLVIAAKNLTATRSLPQGRALERFLSESGDWARSAGAWAELSKRLDVSIDQAVDTLLGTNAVLAVDNASEEAGPLRFAVVSTIRPEVRRDLADRLGAVPRTVSADVPVLAVERGAFHLAMPTMAGTSDWSRLVLSSNKGLFENVLQSVQGRPSGRRIGDTPAWPRIEPLTDTDLLLLVRGHDTAGAKPDEFLALAATPTPQGWTARFLASDPVVDGGLAGVSASAGAWPSEAVDHLENGAVLLVAGSPQVAGGKPPTLLSGLLGMMGLPDDLRKNLDGTAIVSLHVQEAPQSGGALTVVLPLRSIADAIDSADAWAGAVAGTGPGTPSPRVSDGVRDMAVSPENRSVVGGFLKGDAQIAWCYAAAGGVLREGATPGWLVMTIRFGPGEDPAAMVRQTASLLAHDAGRDQATLFRLVAQPRRLNALTDAPKTAPANVDAAKLSVNRSALRWLDRVESRITRESKGLVEGTINLDLNLPLLSSAAAPAAAQSQSAPTQGQ